VDIQTGKGDMMKKLTPKEAQAVMAELEGHLLPSRRRELELEFHQWAKDTGARADVFNVIGWLQERGLMLSDKKRQILIDMRNELKRTGWMDTAAMIDEVLKD